jgi:hypothetical protein
MMHYLPSLVRSAVILGATLAYTAYEHRSSGRTARTEGFSAKQNTTSAGVKVELSYYQPLPHRNHNPVHEFLNGGVKLRFKTTDKFSREEFRQLCRKLEEFPGHILATEYYLAKGYANSGACFTIELHNSLDLRTVEQVCALLNDARLLTNFEPIISAFQASKLKSNNRFTRGHTQAMDLFAQAFAANLSPAEAQSPNLSINAGILKALSTHNKNTILQLS